MQPIKQLTRALADLSSPEHYLFTQADLRALLPALSDVALKTLLSGLGLAGHASHTA